MSIADYIFMAGLFMFLLGLVLMGVGGIWLLLEGF
jgi:hypothetical protein